MSETLNITLKDVEYLVEFEFYPAEGDGLAGLYDFWEITDVCRVDGFCHISPFSCRQLEENYSKEIHEAILQRVKELKENWDS